MRTFFVIWSGQLVSTIGSGLTGFALGVWIYQETGSVTMFALNMLAVAVPNLVVSPFAGALVDRWDRRWVMIMSDTGAGLATLSIAVLYMTDNLEVWNIILATAFNSAFSTFQWPAYSAVTTLLVPKEQLGRAGGMVQIGEAISQLLAPAAGGALFVTIGLGGVIAIDFVTYLFAVLTLLFVRVPSPERSEAGKEGQGSIWKEALYGWTYISARAGLLGLLLVFAAFNFVSGLIYPLIMPMILDMTSADVLGYPGLDRRDRYAGGHAGDECLGWTQAPHPWCTGIPDDLRFFYIHVGNQPLDPGYRGGWFRFNVHHADHQRLQPGHLAEQGRSGCPGTGFCCAAHDRLVDDAPGLYRCWTLGRPGIQTPAG